jgi:xanthosine utilization system XapX-like protein|tara:strand:+ start:1428 stop:1670 length:243 start_codon:yes stop_codon:yes gene_type:complete
MDKLKSRKLLITLAAIAVVAIATFLGLELPAQNAEALLGVVAAYLVGQGAVDAAAAIHAGKAIGNAAKGLQEAADDVELA